MRLLLLALALVAPLASAQVSLDAGTLTVTGSAVVSAAPDRAVVRLGVQTRAETPAAALRAHEADMARVLATVRSFGVADRDIAIEGLGLGENYGPNGPDGFVANRVVSVTIDSLRIVPDLVAGVVEVGANRLEGLFYTLRDSERYQNQALDAAVERAREKAARLASAAGRTLGPVEAIVEQGAGLAGPYQRFGTMDAVAVSAETATPAAYSTGSSQVQASVVVRFALQ